MLTQEAPAREAARPWPQRLPTPLSDSLVTRTPHSVPPSPQEAIDGEVEIFLSSVRALTGADELVLSIQGADEGGLRASAIGRTGLSDRACRSIAECSSVVPSFGGEAIWIDCLTDGRSWQILRLSVPSRRGRSLAAVNLVFAKAPTPRRRAIAEQLCAVQPMVDAYLKLWQRSRADARRTTALHSALSSIDIGIIAIDRNARIVFANDAATGHLASGEHLRRNGDSLSAIELRDTLALQVALSHTLTRQSDPSMASTSRRAPILALRSSRSEHSILLSFIPASGEADEAAAIVCIVDPRLDTIRQLQPVCKLYGLSPVETGLVCHIANGESLLEAATALRIKEKTARGYLQQIFSKTGCKRQADLVRLMLCSLLRTRSDVEPAFLT
jgi:DNA-binding CsgD family transcriptional regulator/PAS domain-containing protein